jgi:hypothetical protein
MTGKMGIDLATLLQYRRKTDRYRLFLLWPRDIQQYKNKRLIKLRASFIFLSTLRRIFSTLL